MPRKAFVADLQDAILLGKFSDVSDIRAGDEDGTFTFKYTSSLGTPTIQVLVPDVSEYPSSHQFFIYTTSDNPPPAINDALESMSGSLEGLKISQLLTTVSTSLGKELATGTEDSPYQLDEDDDPMDIDELEQEYEDNEAEEGYDSDQSVGGWSDHSQPQQASTPGDIHDGYSPDQAVIYAMNARIREDLRAAKEAGFKVGHLGSLMNNGQSFFVAISCRIAKLGISEEALQAWHLDRRQYLVFLIHYTSGYMTTERLAASENAHARRSVEMRVGVGDRYKPTLQEAIDAFSVLKKKKKDQTSTSESGAGTLETSSGQGEQDTSQHGFHGIFISRPLNDLINDRLFTLLRTRIQMGIGWGGAEEYYNDSQGKDRSCSDEMDGKYWQEAPAKTALPKLATADHLLDIVTGSDQAFSFPLLGMQFVLRHVVRCTEFCLVCHCKVEADFEALKPYVCSKPLCLYQYMALGFGPSIEYEILSQPYVVDLLVSFCYASAQYQRLKDFPLGMSLTVPPGREINPAIAGNLPQAGRLPTMWTTTTPTPPIGKRKPLSISYHSIDGFSTSPAPQYSTNDSTDPAAEASKKSHKVEFDQGASEIIFNVFEGDVFGTRLGCPVRAGDWIALSSPPTSIPLDPMNSRDKTMHCQVLETTYYPRVTLSPPVYRSSAASMTTTAGSDTPGSRNFATQPVKPPTPAQTPQPGTLAQAEFYVYNQNFDSLHDDVKRETICLLLETLPSIKQMRDYLLRNHSLDTSLRSWSDRISPAALGVLRWIIASNRSCIVQVDDTSGPEAIKDSYAKAFKAEERVYGMGDWMQFRFAMGAPDKEQRFVNSVREATNRLILRYPTMFAWHGSPIHNWHGIVREGLHFRDALHGRAFGNGCYHSLDYNTSAGYSGSYHRGPTYTEGHPGGWPQSMLKISSAMSLNEIVNSPNEFVSRNPHLVVAQLDWIQTRYLFVRCNLGEKNPKEGNIPTEVYNQDPAYTATGERPGQKIIIPITAVSKARRSCGRVIKKDNKKLRLSEIDEFNRIDDDAASVDTEPEDLEIFFEEQEDLPPPPPPPPKSELTKDKGKGKAMMDVAKNLFKPKQTDMKAPGKILTAFVPGTLDHTTLPLLDPPSYATPSASKTLQRELKTILKVQEKQPTHELGWYINPELISNVYQWIIELHSFESHLPLAKDMKTRNIKSVILELRFGKDYPMSPPFVRVIRPRFLSFMSGGGGHVTAGGALCMELLTNSGWSAVNSIESILLQVRLAISSTDPKPARLEPGGGISDYHVAEAVDAYIRACRTHGWEVPKDFGDFGVVSGG
ncbi:MAG: hypothetical protein M1812_006284 [Candelaria pacifica]|nr:MAG: hypothetical protein M1812_006284 [Candelaria pacifica]